MEHRKNLTSQISSPKTDLIPPISYNILRLLYIYTYHLQNFMHLFRLAFNLIPAFAKVISPRFFPINISFAIPTLPNSVYDIIPSLSFILRSSAPEYRLLHIHFCFGDWSES